MSDWYGLIAQSVFLAVIADAVFSAFRKCHDIKFPGVLPGAVFVMVLLVPVAGLPLAAYSRGLLGDFSVVSLLLLLHRAMMQNSVKASVHPREYQVLTWFLCVLWLLLYPSALGFFQWDTYRIGFSYYLPLAMLALVPILLYCHFRLLAGFLLAALTANYWGIMDSTNTWDYLLDPLAPVWAYWGYRGLQQGQFSASSKARASALS